MAGNKQFIKTAQRLVIGVFIAFSMFGSLAVIPLSKASAAPVLDTPRAAGFQAPFYARGIPEQISILSAIDAIDSDRCPFMFPSVEEVQSDIWFDTGKDAPFGLNIAPDKGKLGCGNEKKWFGNLLDAAGYGGNHQEVLKQVGNVNTNLTQNFSFKSNAREILLGIFKDKLFDGGTIPVTLEYLQQPVLLANFTAANGCGAQPVPDGITPDALVKLKNKNNIVPVNVLDGSNTVSSQDYAYPKDKIDLTVNVGFIADAYPSGDGALQCKNIAGRLADAKYANALSQFYSQYPQVGRANASSSTSSDDINLNCGSKLAVFLNPLNWLLCPIIEGLATFSKVIDNGINASLNIKTDELFDQRYKDAWASVRNYALVFLIIATLVMVLSQALGFEFLDAYTIKKVLPRIFIAGIGLALSWYLMKFFVELTNDLGHSIKSIIYKPFSGLNGDGSITLGGGGLAVSYLIGGAAFAALGPIGLLSFVATAALAILIAFGVLILRKILIIVLVILAPIAIICYILPNTKKVWSVWWDAFSKALLMFPIIVGFITVGRIVAATAASAGGAINSFIAFIAYFAPYFLIPLTFKFAGGLLGNIGGFVNNQGRGAFDGLKKFRGNKAKQRRANASHRAQTGKIFKNASGGTLRNRVNRGVMSATQIGQGGLNPLRFGSRVAGGVSKVNEQQRDAMLEDKDYVSKGDDTWNRAAYAANGESDFRRILGKDKRYKGPEGAQNLDLDVSRYRSMNQKYGTEALRQATYIQSVAGGTAHDEEDENGVEHASRVWEGAASVAGNDNGVLATLVARGRKAALDAGRVDQGAGGFGDTMGIAQKLRAGSQDGSYTLDDADRDLRTTVRKSNGGATAAYGKPRSAKNVGLAHSERIQELVQSMNTGSLIAPDGGGDKRVATDRDVKQALASAHGVHDALRGASPDNARAFADALMSTQIDTSSLSPAARAALGPQAARGGVIGVNGTGGGAPITIRQIMDDLAGHDQQYLEIRTDYATNSANEMERLRGGNVGGQPNTGGGVPGQGAPSTRQ